MRKFIFVVLFTPLFLQAQKIKVSVEVKSLRQYCGGARPSEEIEKEYSTPQAHKGAIFLIVKDKKIVATVKTNELGTFKCKLKKGSYQVFESWRYTLQTPNNLDFGMFDKTCLIKEWERAYGELEVDSKSFRFKELYPIIKLCDWSLPCLNVEVPVPPSAPPPGREQ